jgi:Suppressor of fused protein (SUFU)
MIFASRCPPLLAIRIFIIMFNKLKNLFTASVDAAPKTIPSPRDARLATMIEELGEPNHVLRDDDKNFPVDIYAFGRDFGDCDDDDDHDEGYVLVTNGMSDKLMHRPVVSSASDLEEESLAVELIWYVREVTADYIHYLRWLAKLPQIDETWFGSGHTVPMPEAPLDGCAFKTFFFMSPIIETDKYLLSEFQHGEHDVEMLTVNLISDAEYALVKTNNGLNQFFDLLDEKNYPTIHDPERASFV